MKEAATIKFRDSETGDEAVAIVRYDKRHIALCLSLKPNGDVEVVMGAVEARKLLEALAKALR